MSIRTFGLMVATGVAVSACAGGATPPRPDQAGGSGGSSGIAGTSGGASGSTAALSASGAGATGSTTGTTDAGTSRDGGSLSGAVSGDGGGAHVDAGDAGVTAPLPYEVTMQSVGRQGQTLLFTVQGNDPAGQTTEAAVQLFDANSKPVIAFDTNWDGIADSSQTRLHFDQSTLGQTNFVQTITLTGMIAAQPTIAQASVSLSDANGHLSSPLSVTLISQTVDAAGAPCDVNEVTDRCPPEMACTGKMPTCQAGAAPSLSQVVYYGGANPSEIFVGSDPAETLSSITVSFLSAQGTALSVDPSGDGTAGPVSSVTLDARSATGQSFYFQNNPAATFPAEVPKISVLATDSSGRSGAPVTASVTTQPMHGAGQPCDAYGIVACTVGNVCSPGLVGATNACGALPSLQTAKCSAAPLTTTGTVLAGWGTARGVSLWDPPAGCASGDSIGRPEGIVMLTLSHEANILTVSSATPETNFDTILYVVPACAASSAAALGCNDDSQGYSSTVTLTNVPAGTYTIVVDSAGAQGGQFGITISEQ